MLDTHAWVWSVGLPAKLSRAAVRAIERADRVCVPGLVVFEVADLAERGRMKLRAPTREWVRQALSQKRVELLPLTDAVAVDAAQLRFATDPFDRVIYATARAEDARIVTRDERMHAFDPGRAVW